MTSASKDGIKAIGVNRKARHDFFILETFEAGLELQGSEVKSLRQGSVNLKEGYVNIRDGEAFLEGVHISPYEYASHLAPNPIRTRRLLLHRREIRRIDQEKKEKRLAVVPLRMYFKRGRAKIEIGLAKGKKQHDKRHTLKEKEAKRSLERTHQVHKKK